jgi:hypothetical protein
VPQIYILDLSPLGALICRIRLPWYCDGLHPQQDQHKQTRPRRTRMLSSSRLHSRLRSPPPFQLRHCFQTGCDCLCVRSCSIRGHQVPGGLRFPATFHPSIRQVHCDSSDCVVICSFHPSYLLLRPAPSPYGICFPNPSFPITESRHETVVSQGLDMVGVTLAKEGCIVTTA